MIWSTVVATANLAWQSVLVR